MPVSVLTPSCRLVESLFLCMVKPRYVHYHHNQKHQTILSKDANNTQKGRKVCSCTRYSTVTGGGETETADTVCVLWILWKWTLCQHRKHHSCSAQTRPSSSTWRSLIGRHLEQVSCFSGSAESHLAYNLSAAVIGWTDIVAYCFISFFPVCLLDRNYIRTEQQ